MHGALTPAQVGRLSAEADAFVSASVGETYGMAFAEALAAGLPIVGWHTGNLPNLIEDGREGCLVALGDVAGLTRALHRLSTDNAWRHQLERAAQHRSLTLPTWDDAAAGFFGGAQPAGGTPRLNQRTTGPSGPTSIRDRPASSTYIRQAMSTAAPSAQANAALIGLTWVTTTIVEEAARSTTSSHAAPTRAANVASDSPPGANDLSRSHLARAAAGTAEGGNPSNSP